MSASLCIKCGNMVSGYQKYCDTCVKTYGVKQDENWDRRPHWLGFDYDKSRKAEFEKDLESAKERNKIVQKKKAERDAKKRQLCIGGCGQLVMPKLGSECRKCRRKRLLDGKRRIVKVSPKSYAPPKFETSKQKFDRVKSS